METRKITVNPAGNSVLSLCVTHSGAVRTRSGAIWKCSPSSICINRGQKSHWSLDLSHNVWPTTNCILSYSHWLTKAGFPDRLGGKESTCNAGDPHLVPGSGRSTGEGMGYPFQYSWASLVAQLIKNLPAMWETWVQSLGWEDPLEKGKATYSSILA